MRIAKEGFEVILFFFVLSVIVLLVGFPQIAGILFLITMFVLFFFRDPERKISTIESFIVSPADGRIVQVLEVGAGAGALDVPAIQLSIFMSVFDVHVNRAPLEGRVLDKKYNPGKFLPAYREKASKLNEQTSMLMETKGGAVRLTQIAGLVARRIVCRAQKGDILSKGERFGLIKFGSRVDLFLPQKNARVAVCVGEKVWAGESVIAYFL